MHLTTLIAAICPALAPPGVGAGPPVATAPAPYTERLPGTGVSFEMRPIPEAGVWMGRTEVTWDEFEQYYLASTAPQGVDAVARPTRTFEAHDQGWGRGRRPAVSMSRYGAEMYCRWLSRITGRTYRLPTEAEWSIAASADGGDASLDDVAWHAGNSGGTTHEVGRKAPNAYGLVDILGNVAEYCAAERVVVRGGSWADPPERVHAGARRRETSRWNYRDPNEPQSRWWRTDATFAGFRVVRSFDDAAPRERDGDGERVRGR